MALCLAESLIEKQGFDAKDQMTRYLKWYEEGHLSSNGICFDIGIGTRKSVLKFKETGECFPGDDIDRAGNGSIMRLAPVVLYFSAEPKLAFEMAVQSSRTTHGHQQVIDSVYYMTALILGALQGRSKDELLAPDYYETHWPEVAKEHAWCDEVKKIAQGSFKIDREGAGLVGSGYVIDTLNCALWAFFNSTDFRDGCLLVANLGNDADSTAAVYGQIAGAYYGVSGIPSEWYNKLSVRPLLDAFMNEIEVLSNNSAYKTTKPSADYEYVHKCYIWLEENYAHVTAKLMPGPKAYKNIKDFDDDVANIETKYNESIGEVKESALKLLEDWKAKRIDVDKDKLKTKLSRPNPIFFAKK
jgi:ADP-ribosylglycohydrolase